MTRWRRHLARALERVLDDAYDPPGCLSARVPVERAQVFQAEPEIEILIARLRDAERPARPEGVLLALDLLSDPRGPLFEPAEPGALRRRVRVVCEAVG
jgi:hypothetical protein